MSEFNAAFWKWFGNSVVRNPDGTPMVVWHAGTVKSEFDISRCEFGCHFGAKAHIASWTEENAAQPYFLSIQKPLRMPDLFVFDSASVAAQLMSAGVITKAYLKRVFRGELGDEAVTSSVLRAEMLMAGYDGIVYLNRREGVSVSCPEDSDDLSDEEFLKLCPEARDSWIILDSKQAKSAIGNDGTWDADDPDVRSNPGWSTARQADSLEKWLAQENVRYRRSKYTVKGGSVYFKVYDQYNHLLTDVRVSDHGQAAGGGYSVEHGERAGEADLSVDPTTGKTWRDAADHITRVVAEDADDPDIRSNPRLKSRFANFSQDDFIAYVSQFADQFERGHPARVPPSAMTWRYVPDLAMSRLAVGPEEWALFMDEERSDAECSARMKRLASYWKKRPDNPVVGVDDGTGGVHLWDGNHRAALSSAWGWKSIPAIVGTPSGGTWDADDPDVRSNPPLTVFEQKALELKKLMLELDIALTKREQEALGQAHHKLTDQDEIIDFISGGREYYLSDGGYSRIVLNDSSRKLFLTSNSLQAPRDNWRKTHKLRERIERVIEELHGDLTGDPEIKSNPMKTLYHVTFTKNVNNIMKKGILPFQTSIWVKAGTGERYGEGQIFAFDALPDAMRWAAAMDWEFHKKSGSGKVSIVMFVDDKPWEIDESDPIAQIHRLGNWLKRFGAVTPQNIKSAIPFTAELAKRVTAMNPAKHKNEVFRFLWRAWDVTAAWNLVGDRAANDKMFVKDAESILRMIRKDERPDEEIDLNVPLIGVTFKDKKTKETFVMPIDGWHRIEKALRLGVKELPIHVLSLAESKKVEIQ